MYVDYHIVYHIYELHITPGGPLPIGFSDYSGWFLGTRACMESNIKRHIAVYTCLYFALITNNTTQLEHVVAPLRPATILMLLHAPQYHKSEHVIT